jgi:hypothetical protein
MSHNPILVVRKLITNNAYLSILPNMKNVLYELKHVKHLTDLSLNYLSIIMTLLKNYSNIFNIAFICSKKLNEIILKNNWKGNVSILHELSIPYNKTIIENIKHQTTDAIFDTTTKEFKLQKKIYGYFLAVDPIYNGYGFNASYFFTNKNTYDFFQKNITSLELKYFENLKKIIVDKELSHCIVGEAAVKLLKNNTDGSILKTEIWDMSNNKSGLVQYSSSYTFKTSKIEWFNNCYLIPRHEKKMLIKNSTNISEKVICYYKGLKFLYIDSDYSNISIITYQTPGTSNYTKSFYKPHKKTKITNVWKDLNQKTNIYKNIPISFMTKFSNGFWIMRPNGNFDTIISKNMYMPMLSEPFLAVGTFKCLNSVLTLWSANKFSNKVKNKIYVLCKQAKIKHIFNDCVFKRTNRSISHVKSKMSIINEHQRNNISVFSTLLS